jgi:hypothetical protein
MNSQLDQRFKPFFEKVFLAVELGTVWEDYETIQGAGEKAKFKNTLEESNALFLILSQGAQITPGSGNLDLKNTRFSEGKDVFVFEHCEDLKRISSRVPIFEHSVSLYITNAWTDYVVKMAETYEDPRPAPAVVKEGDSETADALAPRNPSDLGEYFDRKTGMAMFDHSTSRPVGKKAVCPHCSLSYLLHRPADLKVARCPGCGGYSEIKSAPVAAVSSKAVGK